MAEHSRRRPALERWLHPQGTPWGRSPEQWDPTQLMAFKRRLDHVFGPGRYFRIQVLGWEHLPDPPAMMVSNHSGGTTVIDGLGFGHAWVERWGTSRPLHGLVHDLMFSNRVTGPLFSALGAVRASRGSAEKVLRDCKRDLLIFPGGDQDTWRRWTERYTVKFAGRRGYARLALELGIPVVPVAHAGAQESFVVLRSGRRIAKTLGLQKLARAEIFPVHLSMPWGLGIGPLPHLPLPLRFDYRLGPPVPFPSGFAPGAPVSGGLVEAYDQAVRDAIQGLLDRLRASRERFFRRLLTRGATWLRHLRRGDLDHVR